MHTRLRNVEDTKDVFNLWVPFGGLPLKAFTSQHLIFTLWIICTHGDNYTFHIQLIWSRINWIIQQNFVLFTSFALSGCKIILRYCWTWKKASSHDMWDIFSIKEEQPFDRYFLVIDFVYIIDFWQSFRHTIEQGLWIRLTKVVKKAKKRKLDNAT